MNCVNCNKETNNPKFCSMSCSAKFTNRTNPKKKPQGLCKSCGQPCKKIHVYCKSCKKSGIGYRFWGDDITLEQATDKRNGRQNAFGVVRARARKIMESVKSCQKCGYNKHVQIAHIKPIASFAPDTPISVINSKDNLTALCPNCHWEFDNLSG